MKKTFLVAALCLACAFGAFAGDVFAEDGMLLGPNTMSATIGFDFGLGVNAGLEYTFGQFDISSLRFSYGAKGVASIWFPGMFLNAGAMGTIHFSWACIDLPENLWWVKNIDSFTGIGLGFAGSLSAGTGGIGFFTHGGSSYFFSKTMAVTVAGGLGGSYIGLLLKF